LGLRKSLVGLVVVEKVVGHVLLISPLPKLLRVVLWERVEGGVTAEVCLFFFCTTTTLFGRFLLLSRR
jgi:hypothetical protein